MRTLYRIAIVGFAAFGHLINPLTFNIQPVLTQTPLREGEAVREENSFATYQVVGGAIISLMNRTEFDALGYSVDRITVLSRGALKSYPVIPRQGTLIRERSDMAVYVIDGGQRRWVISPAAFNAAGFSWKNVRVVANGATISIPKGPDLKPQEFPSATAAGVPKCPASGPFAQAKAKSKGHVGHRVYTYTLESLLYRCNGYVEAIHTVFMDSRNLPMGFALEFAVGTRRSDGRVAGVSGQMSLAKRYEMFTIRQYRGVGGGLSLTDVRLNMFPAAGQVGLPLSTSIKASYHKWNGPEATAGS